VLVGGEYAGLAQQLVDQRGLAVVDVGDDGDVANESFHERLPRKGAHSNMRAARYRNNGRKKEFQNARTVPGGCSARRKA
jgi:hypothetical protein